MSANEYGFPQSEPPNSSLPKIRSVFDFTAEALEEVAVWLEQRGLTTPVSQIIGFRGFTIQDAPTISTSEGKSASTYGDLATVGPSLTGLSDGKYAVFFGCTANNPAVAGDAWMSVSVNGATATDTDAIVHSVVGPNISLSRVLVKTLSNGDNTLTAKYKGDGVHTSNFLNRWMIAQRIANS